MGKQIIVSNSFVFHFVFYFISGYFFLLVYFFSLATKTQSRPNLFRTSENNVPLFSFASRLGSCCITSKSASKNQSIWPSPAFFFSLMSNEFFIVSVLLLFLERGQCDSSKFETLTVSV